MKLHNSTHTYYTQERVNTDYVISRSDLKRLQKKRQHVETSSMSAQQIKSRFPKRIDLILHHLAAKLAKLPQKPTNLPQRPKTAVKLNA